VNINTGGSDFKTSSICKGREIYILCWNRGYFTYMIWFAFRGLLCTCAVGMWHAGLHCSFFWVFPVLNLTQVSKSVAAHKSQPQAPSRMRKFLWVFSLHVFGCSLVASLVDLATDWWCWFLLFVPISLRMMFLLDKVMESNFRNFQTWHQNGVQNRLLSLSANGMMIPIFTPLLYSCWMPIHALGSMGTCGFGNKELLWVK